MVLMITVMICQVSCAINKWPNLSCMGHMWRGKCPKTCQNSVKKCKKNVWKKVSQKSIKKVSEKQVFQKNVPKKCLKVYQVQPGMYRCITFHCWLQRAGCISQDTYLLYDDYFWLRWCDAVKLTWTVQRHLWSPSVRFPARRNKARCLQCIL